MTAALAIAGTMAAQGAKPRKALEPEFQTSDRCLACHNGLTTPDGKDVSIGFDWRSSIMANSARDPYWQASVRREGIDHPESKAEVEDAIDNVEYTGRAVGAQDKKQLRMIMSHWCGWSPTSAEHRNDPWMQHLRRTYLLPELQPILDTLTWPEEFAQYPPGRTAAHPSLFFLVTSTSYYIYNFVDFAMFKVGDQLSDVVDGLQRERWIDGELWEEITGRGYEGAEDYFPVYYRVIQSD